MGSWHGFFVWSPPLFGHPPRLLNQVELVLNSVDVAAVLSPDDLPFVPHGINLGSLNPHVVSPRACHSTDGHGCAGPLLLVVSTPAVLADNSLNPVVLDCPNESALVSNNVGAGVCEGSSSATSSSPPVMNDCLVNNNFVDVPGIDVRVHLDWLHGSSDCDSDSVSLESIEEEDPGNSFALLRDKPQTWSVMQITVKYQPVSCLSTATTMSSSPARRSANFKPTIWDDSFIRSLPIDFMEEKYINQRNKLKEKVRSLIGQQHGLIEQLEFVDALCQLGLDYHFHSEIKNLLCFNISSMEDENNSNEENNLNGSALLFRLLREHGINNASIQRVNALISCFKKERENLNQNHEHDVKGMLSLYEASYLAMEGEEELEEAGKLAMEHLKCIDRSLLTQQFIEEIDHALELPLHWRMSRLHTRWFIDAYGRRENFNPTLLELAKLDFNMVQSIYKAELQELSMWWRNLGLVCEELDFVRDRLVENYLWSLGITFQPNFGRSRKAITKIICLATTIDDIYDIYGTLDELKLFTNTIEEWKIEASQQLPDYMKICLIIIFNTMNDIVTSFSLEKALDILPCLKRAWVDSCKSQLLEAKWYHNGYTPTLDEYLENAWVSISGNCALTAPYCLSDDLTINSLNSFEFYPPIIRYSCIIFRLYDDLQTSTEEIKRGDVSKSIQCYMKEKNVSETVARDYIKCLIRIYWKKLNHECITYSNFLEPFRKALVGLPRTAQCFYQHRDGYAESNHETKDQINCIIIEPIPL
ncbi:terpene synthase 10-like [Dendrobium catenatum]|uniref:terpene synthase 10-like n=1 Tax=Dendrobium catenatum TaxID=906689 RepID=UPI0010A094DA|nr:terpene synthase 10-like [Dendrobium catenatum]